MILYIRSNEVNPDPRLEKYINFCRKKNVIYKIIAWNRTKSILNNENVIYFNKKSSYGSGIKNIFNIILWNLFIFKTLIKIKNIDIVHACDFDTVFPCIIIKKIKKYKLIYDIFDWYSDSRNTNNKLLIKYLRIMEIFACKNVDHIIICEDERKKQIGVRNIKSLNISILPNIPDFKSIEIKNDNDTFDYDRNCINISYVGVLSSHRGIIELCEVAKKNQFIRIKIAGFGELENKIIEYAEKYKNILFYKRVNYEEALKIQKKSDLIYAMYYKTIKNHIYAAPNKFYESLFLEVPLITTAGTLVGEMTKKFNLGFVIDEGYDNLNNFLNNKNAIYELLPKYKNNLKKLWEIKYKNYINIYMENNYFKLLRDK